MVTMQRQGEATSQTFSLPLTVLAGDEITSTRQYERVHDSGLLDVSVKYQQVRSDQLKQEYAGKKEENNFVCLSLNVLQACGLKVQWTSSIAIFRSGVCMEILKLNYYYLFWVCSYVCCWGIRYTFTFKKIRKVVGGQFVMLKIYLFIHPWHECG